MDDLIIDEGVWQTLTPFQKSRVIVLKPTVMLLDVQRLLGFYCAVEAPPFKDGDTKYTARVELGHKLALIIHAQNHPAK
jgi:hypothetical protein